MKVLVVFLALMTWSAVAATSELARDNSNQQTGRIVGIVRDKNDASIVDAAIKIENANSSRELRSDNEGRFELDMPEGVYQMTVEHPGFRKFQLTQIDVLAGKSKSIQIHLAVEPPQTPLKVQF